MTDHNIEAWNDHHAAEQPETDSDRRWSAWCRRVEEIAGIASLDGDQEKDGYSLDYSHDAYRAGVTPFAWGTAIRNYLELRARAAS